jgi:hypothetical protein
MPYKSWNSNGGHNKRAAEGAHAADAAGRVRTEPLRLYDDMSEDEIRAEYALACQIDAYSASQLRAQFPWLAR